MLKKTVLSIWLMAGALPHFAQWQSKQIAPLRSAQSIVIDGRLDEAVWSQAPAAGDFVQFSPDRGAPAAFRTEVKILYDERHLYFGFVCQDPEPERIVANLTRRDSPLDEDDSVVVGLDTHNDKRTAYYFFTNLLGTQADGRLAENGRTSDDTWDAEWQAAGAETKDGWSVELAIPLAVLKFEPGENKTWGLGLGRICPRRLEQDTWTGPVEFFERVSQFGEMTGLSLAGTKKRHEIIPHAIARFQEGEKSSLQLGLDARYAFSQKVSANLTVNPDFATIEADQEQVNLTRFEMNLPEKRNFFLEGAEVYQQRIQLFYSRRIADIYGGLKAYGKVGGFEFSGMAVLAKPQDANSEESSNYAVFRLRQDVLKNSTIGFLAANQSRGGTNRGSAGIDATLFFSEKVNFTGQLALSYGDHRRGNTAFFLRPAIDTSTFHFHVRYSQLGDRFAENANAVGFIRDDNRRELDSALEKKWWPRGRILDRIQYGSNYNIYWGMDKTLRSWEIDESIEFDFKNKLSFAVQHTQEYKLFEKEFRNHQTGLEAGYNTREWQSVRVSYEFGRNFGSEFQMYSAAVNRKIGADFSLEYELTRLVLDPDPESDTTWIHVLRCTHYFSKDLFLKLFYQTNSSIDKHNVQLVFAYRFQPPFGLVQLAYQKGTARFGERGQQGHTLFCKVSYVL